MQHPKRWLATFISMVVAFNLSGTAAVLATGGVDGAPREIQALRPLAESLLNGYGQFFYTWWWMILPGSFVVCMLMADLVGAVEESQG